jgi:protein-disulfide reductase (glutathione)
MNVYKSGRRVAMAAILMLGALVSMPQASDAAGDWNDAAIEWRSYEDGLKAAKAESKPVCLVFFTDWCPHCSKYSGIFHDEKVVEESKKFVMIRLNKDRNAETSAKYAVDGEYIPRTYFLSSDGKLAEDITEQRPTYKYFYNTSEPAGLLRGMGAALKKFQSGS